MSAVPANPKLWKMLTMQARAKFRVYPSPAASHWVHKEYVQKGGRFVASTRQHPAHVKGKEKGDDK